MDVNGHILLINYRLLSRGANDGSHNLIVQLQGTRHWLILGMLPAHQLDLHIDPEPELSITQEQIDEQVISDALDTTGMPDPDLLIRAAGEMRISNFLLWQVSYAEFYITDVLWPDFTEADLHQALRAFAGRHRRFGGLDDDAP